MRQSGWHRGTWKGDENIVGMFFEQMFLDPVASREAGEDVYKPGVICHIKAAAAKDVMGKRMDASNGPGLIERFPDAWREFQENKAPVEGTPLHEIPGMAPERAAAWGIDGIQTVEQFAEVDELVLNRLGAGARDLQKVAKLMLAAKGEPEPPPEPELSDDEMISTGQWRGLKWGKLRGLGRRMGAEASDGRDAIFARLEDLETAARHAPELEG